MLLGGLATRVDRIGSEYLAQPALRRDMREEQWTKAAERGITPR